METRWLYTTSDNFEDLSEDDIFGLEFENE